MTRNEPDISIEMGFGSRCLDQVSLEYTGGTFGYYGECAFCMIPMCVQGLDFELSTTSPGLADGGCPEVQLEH